MKHLTQNFRGDRIPYKVVKKKFIPLLKEIAKERFFSDKQAEREYFNDWRKRWNKQCEEIKKLGYRIH